MKTNKKTLFSSFALICVSAAIAAGATFALFTSNSEANIAITSGKVNVNASLKDMKLYSASKTFSETDEAVSADDIAKLPAGNRAEYHYVEQTEIAEDGSTYFINKGTGKLEPTKLVLNSAAPGDKASVKVHLENASNIDIKYRLVVECTDTSDDALRFFSELRFSAMGEELTKCSKFVTAWETWGKAEEQVKDIDTAVLLPIYITTEGASAHIKYSVEAVQGNAYTKDESGKFLLDFADETVKKDVDDPSKLQDITLNAGSVTIEDEQHQQVEQPEVVVSIPASVGGVVVDEAGVEKDIEEADVLTLKVKKEEASDATLALIEQDVENAHTDNYDVNNYEVSVVNQDNLAVKSTNKPLLVKLFAGLGKADTLLGVYHSGVRIEKVASMTLLEAEMESYTGDKYFYDEVTGYVFIITEHFSPFTAVFTIAPQSADVYRTPIDGNECVYNFVSFKDADEVYELATRYYHADFVVSFDRAIADGEVTLMGHYDAYTAASQQHENFVEQQLPALNAGQEVRLLKDGLNVSVTYLELALFGYKNYDCLAAAVKCEKTYEKTEGMVALMEGAGFDADLKEFVGYPGDALKAPGFTAGAKVNNIAEDLTISVTLRLYKTADFDYSVTEVSPEEYIDINTITYTFEA